MFVEARIEALNEMPKIDRNIYLPQIEISFVHRIKTLRE